MVLAGGDRVHPADLWPMQWHWTDPVLAPGQPARHYDAVARSEVDEAVLKIMRSGDVAAAQGLRDLSLSLAAAQIATENPALTRPALDNLKIALVQENSNSFAWYELAQAYSNQGNQPMADLATAELHYQGGDMRGAVHFAKAASVKLAKGSMDWQHANDILAAAAVQAQQRH